MPVKDCNLGQPYSHITTCCLDNAGPTRKKTPVPGIIDHEKGRPVLDASAKTPRFELDQNCPAKIKADP